MATSEEKEKGKKAANQAMEPFSQDRSTFGNETGFGGFDFGSFGQLISTSDEEEEEEEEVVEEDEEEEEMI